MELTILTIVSILDEARKVNPVVLAGNQNKVFDTELEFPLLFE